MPVLVGKLLGEQVDLLGAVGLAAIAGLDAAGSELLGEIRLSAVEKWRKGLGGVDSPPLAVAVAERAASAVSRALDRPVFSSCRAQIETPMRPSPGLLSLALCGSPRLPSSAHTFFDRSPLYNDWPICEFLANHLLAADNQDFRSVRRS